MKRYEYKVVSYFSTRLVGNVRPEQLEKGINNMARQGWKVHTVVELSEGNFTLLYERELPNDITIGSHSLFPTESMDPQTMPPSSPLDSVKSLFCDDCGAQLLPENRFCAYCGKETNLELTFY